MSGMKGAWGMVRDVLDRATIYLPIILTAAVALGTYWLVRNAPKLLEPTPKVAPTHEPDFFMRGFTVKNFLPNGELRSELSGKEGRHYPDTDTLEVDQVRVRSISPEGLVTHATADRGLSNGDGSEIQLFGNAVVIRDAAVTANGRAMPRLNAIPAGCAFNPRCPRVFDRCRVERPELMDAGATRAACWLVSEVQRRAA